MNPTYDNITLDAYNEFKVSYNGYEGTISLYVVSSLDNFTVQGIEAYIEVLNGTRVSDYLRENPTYVRVYGNINDESFAYVYLLEADDIVNSEGEKLETFTDSDVCVLFNGKPYSIKANVYEEDNYVQNISYEGTTYFVDLGGTSEETKKNIISLLTNNTLSIQYSTCNDKVTITEDMISFEEVEFNNVSGEIIPVTITYNEVSCEVGILISSDTINLKTYNINGNSLTSIFGKTIYLYDGYWYSDTTKTGFTSYLRYEQLEDNVIKIGSNYDGEFYFVIQLQDDGTATTVDLTKLQADSTYTASKETTEKSGLTKIEIYKDKNYLACYNGEEVVVYYYQYDDTGYIIISGTNTTLILNTDGTFTIK